MRLPSVRGEARTLYFDSAASVTPVSTSGGGVRAQSVRPERSVSKVEGLTRW